MLPELLVVAGTGAGAAGVYVASGSKRGEGGYPVRGGTLSGEPSPILREETRSGFIRGYDGSYHRIGSAGAAFAAYGLACRYSQLLAKYTKMAERSLSGEQATALRQGFLDTGVYPYRTVCNEFQRSLIGHVLAVAVHFAQALRLTSRMFEAAEMREPTQPTEWRIRGVDLKTIVFGSWLNPMVSHLGPTAYRHVVIQHHLASAWEGTGVMMIRRWLQAYGVDSGSVTGGSDLQADWEAVEGRLEEGSAAMQLAGEPVMGIGILAALAWAILIVAVGVGISIAIGGSDVISVILGRNLQLEREQAEQFRIATECARDLSRSAEEREACQEQATELAEQNTSWLPGWGDVGKWAAIGGIGVAGYFAYRLISKR